MSIRFCLFIAVTQLLFVRSAQEDETPSDPRSVVETTAATIPGLDTEPLVKIVNFSDLPDIFSGISDNVDANTVTSAGGMTALSEAESQSISLLPTNASSIPLATSQTVNTSLENLVLASPQTETFPSNQSDVTTSLNATDSRQLQNIPEEAHTVRPEIPQTIILEQDDAADLKRPVLDTTRPAPLKPNSFDLLYPACTGAFTQACDLKQEPTLRFLVVGDWGGKSEPPFRTRNQILAAQRMGLAANETKAQFVLSVGDNFYKDGIPTNSDDPRFQQTFESVYTDPSLNIPWYVMAGNHDYYGNVSAQLEYSEKSKRWVFPELYYSFQYNLGNFTAKFIVLDTMILCGQTRSTPPVIEDPQGPVDPKAARAQLAWLEEQLKNATGADYVFVAGHYQVWSTGLHGPTPCMINTVDPLLHKYNVSAYLCGHEHNLQHIRVASNNFNARAVHYVISGAGALELSEDESNLWRVEAILGVERDRKNRFFYGAGDKKPGFVAADANSRRARFQFLNSDGRLLHQFTLPSRNRQPVAKVIGTIHR